MSNLSVKNVHVTRGPDKTKAGNCFFSSVAVAGVAGQFSMAQVLNPAASGVNVVVTNARFIAATTELNGVQLRSYAVALATLLGGGANKFVGGTGSVAQVYYQQSVAHVGASVANFYYVANTYFDFDRSLEDPIVLPPNAGLVLAHNVPNSAMAAQFSWREEAV